ncbi:hypothetical protein [Paenibacillus turpanensis]|uniref:hypothetical protein n=1 Tax=Paenibacillus turpanensis TaxID=2689078 RepID=UPI0014088C41|nr:hypothetical protein [Paenibacillus turpanensis]
MEFEHINRLDISYNEDIQIKVTSTEEMTKHELQMKALEAMLTDMSMDLTKPGADPLPVIRSIFDSLLERGRNSDEGDKRFPEQETLIEAFKRHYMNFRKTSDVDDSFSTAYETVVLSVIDRIEEHADQHDLEAVHQDLREYREIRFIIQDSNDSVKERFEREYQQTHTSKGETSGTHH